MSATARAGGELRTRILAAGTCEDLDTIYADLLDQHGQARYVGQALADAFRGSRPARGQQRGSRRSATVVLVFKTLPDQWEWLDGGLADGIPTASMLGFVADEVAESPPRSGAGLDMRYGNGTGYSQGVRRPQRILEATRDALATAAEPLGVSMAVLLRWGIDQIRQGKL